MSDVKIQSKTKSGNKSKSVNISAVPGCVINERLGLVLGELVGFELFDRGYPRPAVFCGSACGGTFN